MALIPSDGNPYGQIAITDIASPSEWDKESALQLVVQDAEKTRSWINARYFHIRWYETDILYQSPPLTKTWEGTNVPRANITKFTVATHMNSIMAPLMGGLFYEEPPFKLRPRPNTSEDTVRAIEAIFAYQIDQMNFREEVKYGLFSALLNGTGIWKWGWKEFYKTEWQYRPVSEPVTFTDPLGKQQELQTADQDKFEKVPVDRLCAHPFLENRDIRYVLVDPGCRVPDIRKAGFVIDEMKWTFKDLLKLKDEVYYDENDNPVPRYDLPDEATIRSWFEPPQDAPTPVSNADNYTTNTNFIQHAAPLFEKTTADPMDEPLEILERWDNDKVITVLQRKLVIRKEPNPFGKIPFYSVNWWMIQDCFWGIGLGIAIGSEQRLQQGFTNAVADIATLAANQPIIRSRGANINTQQVRARLGGFIDADGDATKALHPMDLPKIQPEIFELIQMSEARTEQTSGANELLVMGSLPEKGRTSMGRTATGAGGLMNAAANRLGGLVEDFNRQVFQPFLWQMFDLDCQFLPPSVYRQILNDELGEDFKVTLKQFLNAGIKDFSVLAGSHLAVKQQMAQAMPLIMQFFGNPAFGQQLAEINEEYVDFGELLHMLSDSGGWQNYYSIVKKLTPQMKARMAQSNPAAAKMQEKVALTQLKGQQKAQQIDQEYTARAVGDLIRRSIESTGMNETLEGAPQTGPVGFGGNEGG